MGFRCVVMLSNDQASTWENDPKLGEKIARAMNYVGTERGDLGYGRVVECTHADTQTLAVIDSYFGFAPISYSNWRRGSTAEDTALRLLKDAADDAGYRRR